MSLLYLIKRIQYKFTTQAPVKDLLQRQLIQAILPEIFH